MKKFVEEPVTKKHLRKVKKRWVVAATSAALLGAGGLLEIPGPAGETITVHAAEENSVPEWSANTVHEVEQAVEAQHSRDTLSYQIQWGDTLSALSMATGVSVEEIAAQNNIANPDLIYAGDFLSGDTTTSQPTEETVKPEQPQADQEEVEAEEEQVVEEAPAEEIEETPEAVEEEPAEEAEEIVPGETVEPMETTEEEPVAKIVVPEDADEEVVEEVIPDEIEEVDVQEVVATEEIVEPADKVVTEQSVAVVADPASHKEPSEAFIRPAQGYLSSPYGYRPNPISGERRLHAGMDIAGSGEISAVQSGTVVAASYQSGWGNYVKIDHGNGLQTLYAHMKDGSIPVSVGDTVSQGQTIGTMGRTGSATGVHLHFEVYVNGIQVDPAPYL